MGIWQDMTRDERVAAIRAGHAAGESQRTLAAALGTSRFIIGDLARAEGIRFAAGVRPDRTAASVPEGAHWEDLSARQKEAVVRMAHGAGRSAGDVARERGTSEGAVLRAASRMALDLAPGRVADGPGWSGLTTAERRERVTAGIAAGMTAAQIARAQDVTRNVIIGVANRAGLRFGGRTADGADGVTKQQAARAGLGPLAAPPAATAGAGLHPPAGSDSPAAAGRSTSRPASPLPAAAAKAASGSPEPEPVAGPPVMRISPRPRLVAPPPGSGRGLMDLRVGMCRYPLWGGTLPPAGEERFCCARVVAGSSWCAEHRAVCVAGKGRVPKAVLRAVDGARRAGR